MPISTDLSKPPYNDDYNVKNDYYKILFQPGVTVQTRELNQLQTMLQKQIEFFGDHVFKAGTIVSGCNFTFYNPYPYAKILDTDIYGLPTAAWKYVGYNVLNETSGLMAWVIDFADGYEASNPDLKTIYLNYVNSGDDGETVAFSPGDTLKVFDPTVVGIEKINILNGGVAFSNSDVLVTVPPLIVSVTSGSLTPGDYITNINNANVEITSVDSTTLASSNLHIVYVKPKSVDLANTQANSSFWTFRIYESITNPAASLSATITDIPGKGLKASIITDGVGKCTNFIITSKGSGYKYVPYVTIRSLNNTTGYVSLNLEAQNYVTKISVSNASDAVGNGYGFGVGQGVIYQKGYFLRTVQQHILVSKYDQNPDNVCVGFVTSEDIIDSNIDSTLLDNAQGRSNEQAPGANRLKLTPHLTLVSTSEAIANATFLTICEWKEGLPYKQTQTTVYNELEDTMATRTLESSGNFVIDPFLVTTRSPLVANNEGQKYNIVVDPGTAYIQGHRVSTVANYNIDVNKGIQTAISNVHSISLNYGNFIRVKELGGVFKYNIGDTVDLYDTAKGFISNTSLVQASNTNPQGTKIGTTKIRSLIQEDLAPGTPNATYRLYIFDTQMLPGKNFKNTKSIYYNGTQKGVCDVVLTQDNNGANVCSVTDANLNQLLFASGVESLKNANSINYMYRTLDTTLTVANTGVFSKDISSDPSELFTYIGDLSSVEMLDLYVIPTENDLVSTSNTGTVGANNGNTGLIGSTTSFLDFDAGDFITISANAAGGYFLGQISSIVNNTFLYLTKPCNYTNATAKAYRTFPKNIPVPFGYRPGLSANCNDNQNLLTLNFNETFQHAGTKTISLGYNVKRYNVTQSSKVTNRKKFVKLQLANNVANTIGPWCLGVPDTFRLRSVFVGDSGVSNTGTNYVGNFYVDHNQTTNYYGLSYLYLKPGAKLNLTSSQFLLCEIDYFTPSAAGFFDTISYISANSEVVFQNDSKALANLSSEVNTFEVPVLFSDDGKEIDLLNQFDFRPYVANTCAPASTYGAAPVNPPETSVLNTTTEKKFPLPDSNFETMIEYYLGRTDSIFVNQNGRFVTLSGPSSADVNKRTRPPQPASSMKLADFIVPPYPNLPSNYSVNLDEILNTHIANQKFLTTRINKKTIVNPTANNVLPFNQARGYTMEDIGNLARRLADVEYYVTLNALESGISNRIVPSSVDPTMDRFKFGVFADDFKTSQFSDLDNPQYYAMKEDGDIVPPKMHWDITLNGVGQPNWIEWSLVGQEIATVGGITDTPEIGPVCALNLANTVGYLQQYKSYLTVTNPGQPTDVLDLTFASNTTIYENVTYVDIPLNEWLMTHHYDIIDSDVYARVGQMSGIEDRAGAVQRILNMVSNTELSSSDYAVQQFFAQNQALGGMWVSGSGDLVGGGGYTHGGGYTQPQKIVPTSIGGTNTSFATVTYYPPVALYFYHYDTPTKIEIYQNNNLIASTASAENLSDSDKTLLLSDQSNKWFNDYPDLYLKNFVDNGSGYVSYAGKITFNYNPKNGSNFKIVVTKGTNSIKWRYVIAYPIDGSSIGCVPPTKTYTFYPQWTAIYDQYQSSACNNSDAGALNGVHYLKGYIKYWLNDFKIPAPTVSILPFDTNADWFKKVG